MQTEWIFYNAKTPQVSALPTLLVCEYFVSVWGGLDVGLWGSGVNLTYIKDIINLCSIYEIAKSKSYVAL
jgi:hypothetical protein